MLNFLVLLIFFEVIYQVFHQKSDSDFMSFLKNSRVLSSKELKKIKIQEKKYQIETLFEQKLISSSQKKKLLLLADPPQNKKQNLEKNMQKLVFLGLGCILIGIVALIAHNWFQISDQIKMYSYLLIFFISTFFHFHFYCAQKQRLCDCFCLVNIGLIIAGTALMGQIFHLTGSAWSAVFGSAVLSVPFVFSSRIKQLIPFWGAVLSLSSVWGTGHLFAPFVILALLPFILSQKSNIFLSAVWIISFVCSLLNTDWFSDFLRWYQAFFMPVAGAWMMIAFLSSLWLMLRFWIKQVAFIQTLRIFLMILTSFLVLYIDYLYTSGQVVLTAPKYMQSVWGLFLTAALPFGAIGLWGKQKKEGMVIWFLTLSVAFIYSFLSSPLCGMIFSLTVLLSLAIFSIKENFLKTFDICLILIVIRIIFQYIDYVFSLAMTGWGLIIIGIVVLLLPKLFKHFLKESTVRKGKNEKK